MSKTAFRRLATVFSAVVALAVSGGFAVADFVTAQSFKLEIATNLVWLDNASDPVVQVLGGQQNFFDRMVAHANPYLRITNLSDHARIVGAQLNLSKTDAKVVDCEWLDTPGLAAWFWDSERLPQRAHFQFMDPVLPGKSVSMRISTAQAQDGYSMWQNLFQTGETPFGTTPDYGIMSLLVEESISPQRVQFDAQGNPIGVNLLNPPPQYDLSTVPRTTYSALEQYGLQTTVTIQPVPEPSAYLTLGAALATLGVWRKARRRSLGGTRKA